VTSTMNIVTTLQKRHERRQRTETNNSNNYRRHLISKTTTLNDYSLGSHVEILLQNDNNDEDLMNKHIHFFHMWVRELLMDSTM